MPLVKRAAIRAVLFVEVLCVLGSTSCTSRRQVGAYSCSGLTDAQYRGVDFRSYDNDKQYAIFICGQQYVHPPMMNLAQLFAEEGNNVVGFLKTKLAEANDDLTIRDLVLVFSLMSALKTYDVANDDELMRLISDRVGAMKDAGWKDTAEEMVARIK